MRDTKGRFIPGHHISDKLKKIISLRQKGNRNRSGKKHTQVTKDKISESRKGKNTGENHHFWKGGRSREYKTGYYSTKYLDWRKAVFERDNYVCQKCGVTGNKEYLTAHHIKSFTYYPKLRFVISNGVTLCEKCHELTDNYKGRANRKNKR